MSFASHAVKLHATRSSNSHIMTLIGEKFFLRKRGQILIVEANVPLVNEQLSQFPNEEDAHF